MVYKKKTVLRYLLPFLTILILIVLLTVALVRLASIQQEMRYNTNGNMVWVIYNAHLESLRLTDVIQKQALNSQTDGDAFFRYQMLLSRINLLHDGPQARFLEKIHLISELHEHTTAIKELEPFLLQTGLSLTELIKVQNTLASFSELMLKASGEAMTAQWDELGAGIDMNRNAVLAIIFIMVGILLCSIFVSIQLLVALKKTRENERVKQHQIELKKQLENERKIGELYRSFGAMVSHQFRTPLAIIDASMQRLIRASHRMTPQEVSHRAVKVKAATERLTHLIETILNADQFMEQVDIQLQQFCLTELAQQIVAEQSDLQPHRQIDFSYTEAQNARVVGDPILTSQIIANFLSNADKYSPINTKIVVKIYQQGNWICCAVQDDGRGISTQDLPYIFQRYFRGSTVADVIGTGIGLYVAAELAALQQGQVNVDSELGVGSTFILSLPRAVCK